MIQGLHHVKSEQPAMPFSKPAEKPLHGPPVCVHQQGDGLDLHLPGQAEQVLFESSRPTSVGTCKGQLFLLTTAPGSVEPVLLDEQHLSYSTEIKVPQASLKVVMVDQVSLSTHRAYEEDDLAPQADDHSARVEPDVLDRVQFESLDATDHVAALHRASSWSRPALTSLLAEGADSRYFTSHSFMENLYSLLLILQTIYFLSCSTCHLPAETKDDLDESKISELITLLNNESFSVRDKAQNDLILYGVKTIKLLNISIRNSSSPEMSSRINNIIQTINANELISKLPTIYRDIWYEINIKSMRGIMNISIKDNGNTYQVNNVFVSTDNASFNNKVYSWRVNSTCNKNIMLTPIASEYSFYLNDIIFCDCNIDYYCVRNAHDNTNYRISINENKYYDVKTLTKYGDKITNNYGASASDILLSSASLAVYSMCIKLGNEINYDCENIPFTTDKVFSITNKCKMYRSNKKITNSEQYGNYTCEPLFANCTINSEDVFIADNVKQISREDGEKTINNLRK
jgi:hypothetical protein